MTRLPMFFARSPIRSRSLAMRNIATSARQNDPKFGELAGLGIDVYGPAMLLDNDVVADGQA
jgi:hypothetical protein